MEHVNGEGLTIPTQEMFRFVRQLPEASNAAYRLGRLQCSGRNAIDTPHYMATTSRGIIPHVAHDMLQKHTNISAALIGLEDFIEKSIKDAPIFKTPVNDHESILRKYIRLPDKCLTILGPRRIPRIDCPAQNTNNSIAICTSVGFRTLDIIDYNRAVSALKPDIATSIVDLAAGGKISTKRIEKMADRTHAWLRDTLESRQNSQETGLPLFASVPPLEPEQQSFYLSDLGTEFADQLSGICVFSSQTVTSLPDSLQHLPRLCLDEPATPQAILRSVALGVDIMTVPFITSSSEHGIALTFTFPPSNTLQNEPLGFDLWDTKHATDVSPLSPGCQCYTCTRHHRAYIHHLLQAKEMLAWTLLQIHNYSILDTFFAQIRQSITQSTFDADLETFNRVYEPELPALAGEGPRVRGYQMKSAGGGEPRKNPKAYGKLDDQMEKLAEAQSGIATPDGDAMDIEKHGIAERVS